MVSKGNHPQMAARFRLVKYYNLPRYVYIYIHMGFKSFKRYPGTPPNHLKSDQIRALKPMVEMGTPWYSRNSGNLHRFIDRTPHAVSQSRALPSGERLHFAMENHHAINGKIHYFYGHFQWLFVCSPGRVNPIKIPLNPIKPPFSYGFPMVFL